MKAVLASVMALCLSVIPLCGSASATRVLVAGGTLVPVHVIGTVSSASMKDGDTFQVQAADDVIVNGMVVIRSGSLGAGSVQEVDHAGGNGHSGGLLLTFDWIYAVDGGKIRLAQTSQRQAEEDRKGASSTATIIGFATFGLGGLFGHNFAHGREVTVDDKKILQAFVRSNVHVAATERAQKDDERFDR